MVEKGEDQDMEKRDMAESSEDLPLIPLGSFRKQRTDPGLAGAISKLGTTATTPRVLVLKHCQSGSTCGLGLTSHLGQVHP